MKTFPLFKTFSISILLSLLFFVSFLPIVEAENYGDMVVSEVTSVYDADTFLVTIDNWPAIIGERIPIRVLGVDAPEIRGRCAKEKVAARQAKQRTVALLRAASIIKLKNIQRGKYFRILADVYVDDQKLADVLIHEGLARAYDGGRRETWCAAM